MDFAQDPRYQDQGSFIYDLPHYEDLLAPSSKVKYFSPVYEIGGYGWRLEIYPQDNYKHNQHLKAFLKASDMKFFPSSMSVEVDYEITLMNWKEFGKKITMNGQEGRRFSPDGDSWGFRVLQVRDIVNPENGWLGPSSTLRFEVVVKILCGQGAPMLERPNFQSIADAEIKTREETFMVHATLLARESHVVCNMLADLQLAPSHSQRLDLTQLFEGSSVAGIKQVLSFVYEPERAKIESMENVHELAELARRLNMPSLMWKVQKYVHLNEHEILTSSEDFGSCRHVTRILSLAVNQQWLGVVNMCETIIVNAVGETCQDLKLVRSIPEESRQRILVGIARKTRRMVNDPDYELTVDDHMSAIADEEENGEEQEDWEEDALMSCIVTASSDQV